jgi:hypothetical protein
VKAQPEAVTHVPPKNVHVHAKDVLVNVTYVSEHLWRTMQLALQKLAGFSIREQERSLDDGSLFVVQSSPMTP